MHGRKKQTNVTYYKNKQRVNPKKRDKARERKIEGESGEKEIEKDKKFQPFASKSVANSPKVIQK